MRECKQQLIFLRGNQCGLRLYFESLFTNYCRVCVFFTESYVKHIKKKSNVQIFDTTCFLQLPI